MLSREVLRTKINKFTFFLFNVSFIALGQNILLFLITTPTYILLVLSQIPGAEKMTMADNIFVRALLGLVIVEFFADGSQWSKSYPSHFSLAIAHSRTT